MRVAVVLWLLLAAVSAGAEPVDPDALAALLADLEASGGILTAADLEALTLPDVQSARGSWSLAVTGRNGEALRGDVRAERHAPRWSFRLRARRGGERDLLAAWTRSTVARLTASFGSGGVSHGAGLLAAPPGRRPSLNSDASLSPPRPGWRTSTATEPGTTVIGGALAWTEDRWGLEVGLARDHAGAEARHVRADVAVGAARLGVLALQRGTGRGQGLDLRWRRGHWLLSAAAARWRRNAAAESGQAWHLSAQWRSGSWCAEAQAAASDASAGLDGAARPACLPGWRGRGWAVRLVGRPTGNLAAAMICGRGDKRDPAAATGSLTERSLLGLQVRGRVPDGRSWELRLRRTDERRRAWDPLQPWLPAAPVDRRSRHWLTAAVNLPAESGEARLTWRWLEEAGESRSLLSALWISRSGRVRWRAGVQAAWGDPLDLVAVSAPVAGLVRLRHWGRWRSGLLIGVEGGRRWRWQCGGEARRGSLEAGGQLALEFHGRWGRSF